MTCQGKVYSSDQWDTTDPAGTESPSDLDSLITTNNDVVDRLLADYREGVKLSYASAATITVGTGQIVCDNSGRTLRKWRENTSALTLAWTDIDTGGEESSKTYYVYACADTDATTFTAVISLNSSSPSEVTYYKRLGSFYNDSDGDISNNDSLTNDNDYYALQLGDWESKSSGTSYLASTDGFVLAGAEATGGDSGRGLMLSDSANPPTTERQELHAASDTEHDSGCMPVKKGDYYKVTLTNGTMDYIYWIPSE